eukprot:TRINITY_DN22806_c0_g1_i1.p1 TRINITY_DN22806_c0_g1~~TRINITY_DN22806_c0_g1_i1.p1  ORF type:complete len:494 (-),score=65.32 TRINITY_DN22806_c0_g1_i1:256-1527(-)
MEANLLVSPLSIATCFSLILPGARGDTEAQISTALSFPDSTRDAVYNAFDGVRASYNSKYPANITAASEFHSPPPVLQIANSIWVDQDLALDSAYQQLVNDSLVVVDFNDRNSSTALNAWVANHTSGKIQSVVDPGEELPGEMIAVNAVYFKATWSLQFEQSMTGYGTFYTSPERQTVVKDDSHYMHQVDYFEYAHTSSHQFLAMPYQHSYTDTEHQFEMVLALPLDTASADLSVADLEQAVVRMQRAYVALAIPKFEFRAGYELNNALKSMGMVAPFSAEDADFTGLSTSTDLFISKVIHKTFIAVDEFGTEAAAVTAIVMEVTSVGDQDPTPVLFKADHPFQFFLRDQADGTVLFAGRVGEPVPPAGSATPAMQASESIWEEKFHTRVITNLATSNACNGVGPWPLLLLALAVAVQVNRCS